MRRNACEQAIHLNSHRGNERNKQKYFCDFILEGGCEDWKGLKSARNLFWVCEHIHINAISFILVFFGAHKECLAFKRTSNGAQNQVDVSQKRNYSMIWVAHSTSKFKEMWYYKQRICPKLKVQGAAYEDFRGSQICKRLCLNDGFLFQSRNPFEASEWSELKVLGYSSEDSCNELWVKFDGKHNLSRLVDNTLRFMVKIEAVYCPW